MNAWLRALARRIARPLSRRERARLQRDRSASRAFRAHLLAALFLLGSLASFAHGVVVPHSVCASHGEWVHGEDDHAATAPEADLEPGPEHGFGTGAPLASPAPAPAEEGHEHCALVLATREGGSIAPGEPVAVARPLAEGAAPLAPRALVVASVSPRSTPARGPPARA